MHSKPKSQRAKRELEKREAKIVENPKHALFLRGLHTSDVSAGVLKDLVRAALPLCSRRTNRRVCV